MDTRRIIQALAYFEFKIKDPLMNKMKAYKLVWLADRKHLCTYGRTITNDTYYAMPKGVVPSDAKNILDGCPTKLSNDDSYVEQYLNISKNGYTIKQSPYTDVFSDSDIEVMDEVIEMYGKLSAQELSNLSHKFPEWIAFKELLENLSEKNSFPIDNDLFFTPCGDISPLFDNDEEGLQLANEVYNLYYKGQRWN